MSNGKQRHGCLTAWLTFTILVNSLAALVYLYFVVTNTVILENDLDISRGAFLILAVIGIFNVVCAIALFQWKKWGFYGFIASSIATLIINLSIGISIVQSLSGLIGIAILYSVLQMGIDNKGWTQLD